MDGAVWMGRQGEDTGKAEEVIVILDAPTVSCQLYDIGCIGDSTSNMPGQIYYIGCIGDALPKKLHFQ